MAQEIINTGAAPNDGDGDNLRTAFTKVNNNFTQVWTAGPVGSNVQIQGNTVSTLQVNQDLALSPNGTGNIRLNNNTIPGANNTWFLGSANNRWRGLFVGNVDTDNLSVNELSVSGDAYINGNLTVVGNTIQIGNITTDTKTIQLANTATTDAAANGAGITVGANDDIATFLYHSGDDVWTTNIGLQVVGAISGYSLAVSDATVYGNIDAINGNFSGNVAANYFIGDGSQLTGIETGATISNTAPALGNGGIWWNSVDGRAYVKYNSQFIDMNPSLVPDPQTYVGNVSFEDIEITNVGNIIPAANSAYSLGSAAFQWQDLWVSNNTIYLNSVPITLGAGNVLQVNGEPVLTNDSDTSIATTGNITADYFIGDGSQLTNLPGGIVFEYSIANFTANALPAAGTMQFTNRDGDVVIPDEGSRLFISTISGPNVTPRFNSSIWRQMADNSDCATMTLQLSGQQQAIRLFNIGVYAEPEEYRGYRAGVNQIWGDDCSINQIIITNATEPVFYNENFDLEDDVFHATNLGDATVAYMVNVYGSTQEYPLNPAQLWNFFTGFVDQVIYQGTNTETQAAANIKAAFYNNFTFLRTSINTDAYYRNFEFADATTYYNNAQVNGGTGTSGSLRVRLNVNNTYTILGVNQAGTEYQVGNEVTVPGTSLGGVSPDNDLVVDVATVDGSGGITAVSIISGTAAYPWPTNEINDGGDDQYDGGNYINTNLAQEIDYGSGNVTAGDTEFGVGSEYVTMYDNSIFCLAATGVDITDLFYSGNLGSDGDGLLRWTGLASPGSPNIVYAYMGCDIGSGSLEPQVGNTYQVVLDEDGINLDQFYSYYNDNTNDWYFGADRDWRLESKQELFVQSYNQLTLRTVIPSDATNVSGPGLVLRTARGSDASAEYNIAAGDGGFLEILAGNGGDANGVPALGGTGGSIEIIAGESFGTNQTGGYVLIESGSSPNGTGGNITIQAAGGTVGNGHIVLRTTAYGVEDKSLIMDSTGNLTMPNNGSLNFNGGGIVQMPDEDLVIRVQDADDDGFSLYQEVDDGDGTVLGQTRLQRDRFEIGFTNGSSPRFAFTESGETEIPGNIRTTDYADTSLYVVTNPSGSVELKAISFAGDTLGSNVRVTQSNATISTDNAQYTWLFDNTGVLTLPSGEGIIRSIDDSISLTSLNTTTGNANSVYLGSSGGLGFYDNEIGGNWLEIFRNGAEPEIRVPVGRGNLNVQTAEGENAYNWVFDDTGNLTLPGNTFAVNYANGTAVTLGSGSGNSISETDGIGNTASLLVDQFCNYAMIYNGTTQGVFGYGTAANLYITNNNDANIELRTASVATPWTFDRTGNLTAPGNIIATGNIEVSSVVVATSLVGNATASPAPSIDGFDSATFLGNISGNYIIGNGALLTDVAIINSGNSGIEFAGPGANIEMTVGGTGIADISSSTFGVTGNISATGNVTAANFVGNITITGNVTGTSPNVTLVAGSYSYTFDNTGVLTLPAPSTGNEGGEIQFTQAGNSTLGGNTVNIDQYVDLIRFFESGGTNRGLVMDIANAPSVGSAVAIGYRDIPQIALSANVTANGTNAGQHFYSTTAGNLQVTIPDNANVAFPTGATLTIVMNAAGNVIVAQGSGVSLYMAGSSTTGNRTVGAYGLASVMKVATNTWVISGTGVY